MSKFNLETIDNLPNLASPQLGSEIVYCTDEWFAECDNMLKDEGAHFDPDTFTFYGKEMDGWECRRRRSEGHDWSIVKLGIPGSILVIEVDTLHFTGNFSPRVSIQGTYLAPGSHSTELDKVENLIRLRKKGVEDRGEKSKDGRMGLHASDEETAIALTLQSDKWQTLVPLTKLGAGYAETSRNFFKIENRGKERFNYLRINMGPDGGIARVRVYGLISVNLSAIPRDREIDLAAVQVGGIAIGCSNMHYGHPRNLVNPGRGKVMGDGWETARQPARPASYERGHDGLMKLPGSDFAVLKLGLRGYIKRIEVDTHLYKGNYPESCLIEGCFFEDDESPEAQKLLLAPSDGSGNTGNSIRGKRPIWRPLLTRTALTAHAIHRFNVTSAANSEVLTHVRITIYPDGGVQRLRLFGFAADAVGTANPSRSRL